MKHLLIIVALFLAGCGEPILDLGFDLAAPTVPPAWEEMLGPPAWRVQWINRRGEWEVMETSLSQEGTVGQIEVSGQAGTTGSGLGRIDLPVSGVVPVLAWPFWPDLGILPGDFHPAGAIFPFDVSGGDLILSWEGGVAAFFYRSLAEAAGTGSSKAALRRPGNFDWPRFRELLRDPALKESFRADPWTADWELIARETVESGFEKRRLVSAVRNELSVPVHPGPWISASPFPAPLFFGEDPPVFPAPPGIEPDAWYSAEGILRCAGNAWIFIPWEGAGSP
ncbi:MAG: hypothetical protein LBR93_09930 [Treponema sp.]|jgi:hypothetical protein|nr:hypothetical protein [Treponema sp.]